ncbi:MAG: hypothetical protein ACK5B8_03940 [Bacteroidota bacterium]
MLFAYYSYSQQDSTKKKEKFLKISGSINIGYWINQSKKQNVVTNKVDWFIQGQPTLKVGNTNLPFSGNYSNRGLEFTQPFNQFGISPTFNNFTAHLGYRNLQYSEYIFAGVTFLGGAFDWQFKKLRMGAFYGRFNKAIDPDAAAASGVSYTVLPSYLRMGYGFKLGLGKEKNHVDFVITKFQDDTLSLKKRPVLQTVKPGDNLSASIISKFTFLKNFNFESEGAVSVYTEDVQQTKFTLDSSLAWLQKIILLNATTSVNPAANVSLGYRNKSFGLGFKSDYIGANYRSLGAYFLQNDLFRTTINPSLQLLKNKISFAGSWGVQNDNLANQKAFKTTRTVHSVRLMVRPVSQLVVQMNYADYGTTQTSGLVQLNDSIRISQINRNLGGNIALNFPSKIISTSINLSGQMQSLDDLNQFTTKFTKSDITTLSAATNFSVDKIGFTTGFNFVYSDVLTAFNHITSVGPGISIGWGHKKSGFKINTACNYQARTKDDKSDGTLISLNSSINYTIRKKHRLGIRQILNINSTSSTSVYAYQQNRIGFTYGYAF